MRKLVMFACFVMASSAAVAGVPCPPNQTLTMVTAPAAPKLADEVQRVKPKLCRAVKSEDGRVLIICN